MASAWLPKTSSKSKVPPLPEKPKEGWQFPTGAYVKDKDGVEYFANPAQAEAYQQKADDESVSDKDFWSWFDTFRKDHRLYPINKWTKSTHSYKGYGGTAGWWQSNFESQFGASSQDRKLAMALRAVSTTVRIVDDSTPPYSVEWASEELSATDILNRRIVINPTPITKPGTLTNAEAIDISTGFGLHEAGHAQDTSKVFRPLFDAKPEPWPVAAFLSNIIEDIRTERLTSKSFPGFAEYFTVTNKYMWGETEKKMAAGEILKPRAWGLTVTDCLNILVFHLKWPTESASILTDASIIDELPWWDAWNLRYQQGELTLLEAVQEGLDRLKSTGSDEMQKQLAQLEGLPDQKSVPEGTMQPCPSTISRSDLIGRVTAAKVNANIKEDLREWKPKIPSDDLDIREPTVWVSHPLETPESKAAYVGRPSGVIERLKDILRFRPELPRWSERLLKSGSLDEEQLYRWSLQDYRVFERPVEEHYPNAQVTLLVDMSGSMRSSIDNTYATGAKSKLLVAQELAQLFVGALSTMSGVSPRVIGHTGDLTDDGDGTGSAEFYELWDPGEPMSRLGLISEMDSGDNFDGFAIEWCVEDLLARGRFGDQRLLVVLSDGEPAGYGYDDWAAQSHVRRVTDAAEKSGVFVVQVAIDPHLRHDQQSRMFKNWVQFTSENELPKTLAKTLSSFLAN